MTRRKKSVPAKKPRIPKSDGAGQPGAVPPPTRAPRMPHSGDDEPPTIEMWQRLYDLAERIRDLRPWTEMVESEIFGVGDPESDQVGFVSIMGQRGEHLSVAVYKGAPGLAGFCRMLEDESSGPEEILDTPHLQVSFEDSTLVASEDRRVMSALGRRYRGRQAWPLFRSYRPGYLPWLIDADEARLLEVVLGQVLEFAPRVIEGEIDIVHDLSFGTPLQWLVRRARREADGLVWESVWEEVDLPERDWIAPEIDEVTLARMARFPVRDIVIEVTFEPAPFVVHEPGQRPYAPRTLLVVDAASGFVLGHDVAMPETPIELAVAGTAQQVADILARYEVLPRALCVRRAVLADVLYDGFAPIDLDVHLVDALPATQEAMDEFARALEMR